MNAPAGSDTVRLTRTIEAPPGEVYRAFLEPDRLRQWFGPEGFVVTDVEKELVPGERIVLSWVFEGPDPDPEPNESVLTVTFSPGRDDTTELTQVHDRLEEGSEGVNEGWNEALDKLEAVYS